MLERIQNDYLTELQNNQETEELVLFVRSGDKGEEFLTQSLAVKAETNQVAAFIRYEDDDAAAVMLFSPLRIKHRLYCRPVRPGENKRYASIFSNDEELF